ncbi:M16 family metallopeptidase [Persephonella sp.]
MIKNILPNGVTVLFKETEGEGIIAGTIFIKGGSFEDSEGKKGLTNLTVKMLIKGSKNFSSYEISKVFEDSGGYISTSVGEEFSTIEFAMRTKDLKEGLKILKDIIFNPVFPEDKLKIEKRNVIAQIKAKKEEGFSYGFDELRKQIYKGTPYQYSPLGKITDIRKITREDLKKRWDQLMNGSRWVVSFVGDMPYTEIESEVKEVFGRINKGVEYQYPVYSHYITGERCKTLKREGAQTTILVAYNAPQATDRFYFSMKVLNGIAGSGFTSRLFQELREKRGLAYAVGSFFPTRVNMGRLIAYIGTAPEKTEESLKGIREVFNSIGEGVTDEELKTAKEKIIGNFLLEHQTRAKQSWYLGWFETIGLGYEMDQKYPEYISKVTRSDIVETWKRYIPEGNVCVIVRP